MQAGKPLSRQGLTAEQLSVALHDLAQPMTVLLCTLEYAAEIESLEEIRVAIQSALRECERLRVWMLSMQQDEVRANRPT